MVHYKHYLINVHTYFLCNREWCHKRPYISAPGALNLYQKMQAMLRGNASRITIIDKPTTIKNYTHHRSKIGTFAPSPAGEGWGEEIQKPNFEVQTVYYRNGY